MPVSTWLYCPLVLFLISPVNGNMQPLSSSVMYFPEHNSLHMDPLAANGRISFLFMTNIPLCVYIHIYIYIYTRSSLSIHLQMDTEDRPYLGDGKKCCCEYWVTYIYSYKLVWGEVCYIPRVIDAQERDCWIKG